MTSIAHAQTLRLRLFLEGIEVPVIAANVQTAPNSPAVATIQIPPIAEATKFHPRTTVHLFFLDLYKNNVALSDTNVPQGPDGAMRVPTDADKEQTRVGRGWTEEQAAILGATDVANNQWRLLFGGEIVGFSWTKHALNRSVILQCEDWSNYWDYAFQANNTDIFGPGMKAVFSGASTNLFTEFLTGEGEVLTKIVTSGKCNTFPKLKGLAAGIIRLIEAIGGSYYSFPSGNKQAPPKRYAGQNLFFSYNELRLHLTQLIGTYPEDPTSERIMRYQGYSGMFQRALGGQGGQVSIRKAITAISKIIFYEVYPQPCPKYKPGGYGEVSGVKRVKLKNHPEFSSFAASATDAKSSLESLLRGLSRFSSEVAVLPDEQVTKIRVVATEQVNGLSTLYRTLQRVRAQMRNAPTSASGSISVALQKIGKALSVAQQLRSSSQRSSTANLTKLKDLETAAVAELTKVEEAEAVIGGAKDRYPAQLYQQIIRPDVWFAAPPRCNVLFPELYDNFSYQRMFLQEPTRFMLKTNDEFFGEDELFDKFYYAPQAGTVKGNKLNLRSAIGRELLNHERFTGILPVFEKMGEFNIFASRAERSRMSIKKVGFAQRSANFLYFRHRFNARRATVTGKFNPYLAVGCPGLIIDKYVDRATIERHNELRRQQNVTEIEASEILGTNFLGNFTQVVHQISNPQPVGVTDITVTFPRQPDESVEFLGSVPEDLRVRKKVEGADAVRSTDIAAIGAPQLYSMGPNKGQITNVYKLGNEYDGKRLPVFYTGARRSSEFKTVEVPVNVEVRASDEGNNATISAILGGDDVVGVFSPYRVTEEIPRYKLEDVLLPAEEYIRPGWYGDIWTNSKIGKVWEELFSTGAITDPTTVTDKGRNSASLRSEASQQAATDQKDASSVDDPQAMAPSVLDLQEGASLQQAIEFLHLTYSYIRQAGLDTDEFIGAYTWRPIANMVDIFGTSDLSYDAAGQNIAQGFEGFHSRAVGPYNDLFGLVTPEIEDVLGIKRGSTTSQNVDIRKERREKVEKYIAALLFGNALLG